MSELYDINDLDLDALLRAITPQMERNAKRRMAEERKWERQVNRFGGLRRVVGCLLPHKRELETIPIYHGEPADTRPEIDVDELFSQMAKKRVKENNVIYLEDVRRQRRHHPKGLWFDL